MRTRNTFFNLRLDPNDPVTGEPNPAITTSTVEPPANDPESAAKLAALEQSVSNLQKALDAERKLKRDAEDEAKRKAKEAADAEKTAEQKLDERLRNVEAENASLRLTSAKERVLKAQVKALDAEGYTVDLEAVEALLALPGLALSEANVETAIATVVSAQKRAKVQTPATPNVQPPTVLGTPKFKFGELGDDALTGS